MTKEELDKIKEIEYKQNTAKYLINNGNITSDSINYLFHQDADFYEEIIELRNKYYDKYNTQLENIIIQF